MPKGDREILKADPEHRKSYRYKQWQWKLLSASAYHCALCGKGSVWGDEYGRPVIVHHIKSYVQYPELRCEPSNGIVLCADCHRKVHKGEIQIIA